MSAVPLSPETVAALVDLAASAGSIGAGGAWHALHRAASADLDRHNSLPDRPWVAKLQRSLETSKGGTMLSLQDCRDILDETGRR